jgi:uncharacterized protein YbjT (DUF2867 family)
MKIVLFGASGMIGSGVLLECMDSAEVESVLSVGRSSTGRSHVKLREIVHHELLDLAAIEDQLTGLDACFWCLGVSAAGLSEEAYRRITVDFTEAAAKTLLRLNPGIAMCFVSGAGTDSSEQGRAMWARVKGRAENLLLGMGFERATMFRPAFIQPLRGVVSKTRSYRVMYAVLKPFYPLLKLLFPRQVTTSVAVGRAMIRAAHEGSAKAILECWEINELAGGI